MSFLKKFENGSFRIYGKLLDDRTAAYMPMPMKVTGSNSDPNWGSLSSYNALTGAMQTINLTKDFTMGGDGNILSCIPSDILLDKMFPSPPIVKSFIIFIQCINWSYANYKFN